MKWYGLFSSRWRSMLSATAAASHGVPSWNVTPGRRWNVIESPSGAVSHEVASAGSTSEPPYRNRTSVSNTFDSSSAVSPSVASAGSAVSESFPLA